jgi:hypothetical protein
LVHGFGSARAGRPAPTAPRRRSGYANGQKYLNEGSFRLAAQELAWSNGSDSLSVVQRRLRQQLQSEATLLADLVSDSLEDILRHAAGVSDAEWQADFGHRFQGKAVVFDVKVWRLPDGKVSHSYTLWVGKEPARLELGELTFFQSLPLEEAQRLVFGARLASARLEPPGPTWVVRLQPESGVLLTQPGAAELCCPPLGDREGRQVLARQAAWVNVPSESGAGPEN